MAERKIDYDRGVKIRTINEYGMDIFMYRNDPGVYLNAHGHEVGEEMGKLAGFDIEKHRLQRKRKQAMAAASEAVDAEILASENAVTKTVVEEKDGYKIILLSAGRHVVEDPDGNVLTSGVVLTHEMAKRVLDSVHAAQQPQAKVEPSPQVLRDRARDNAAGRAGATPLRTS